MKHWTYRIVMIFLIISHYQAISAYSYDGSYANESGSTFIYIIGDTLTIRSNDEEPSTLAVCKCKKISDSFLEINTLDNPVLSAFKDMSVQYDSQDLTDTPAVIKFIMPNAQTDLKINVLCGMQSYAGILDNGICQITLDRTAVSATEKFYFDIAPCYYNVSTPEGQYYGLLYIFYPFDIKCNNNDIITIKLPSVTKSLFSQYYIKGEYVHKTKKGIEWRGELYYRQ